MTLSLTVVFTVSCVLMTGCATHSTVKESDGISEKESPYLSAVGAKTFEEVGIKVLSLRLASAGYMLDLRFQVQDPELAASVLSRKHEAKLIDHKTGAVMMVPSPPKVGSLRQTVHPKAVEEGRVYFALFANPNGLLQTGDLVTVQIGDVSLSGLLVE